MQKDASGRFRWELRGPNGRVIASSDGHESRQSCRKEIESMKKAIAKAETVDLTD